jgi:23S rRNA (adenine1618-N6)-methyltransferase
MIKESLEFKDNIIWFTSLISKGDNIKPLEKLLNKIGAKEIKVINMSQGQKISRILAWTFL